MQTAVLTLFGIHSTKKAEFFVCMSSICWSTWYPLVSCILKQGYFIIFVRFSNCTASKLRILSLM